MSNAPPSARSGQSSSGSGRPPMHTPPAKRFKGPVDEEEDEWREEDEIFEEDPELEIEDVVQGDVDMMAATTSALTGLEDEAKKWPRPKLPDIDTAVNELVFQQLDMDYYTYNNPNVGPMPIIRMFGVTDTGNSICCHVRNFTPYFYVPAPPAFDPNSTLAISDLKSFKDDLNRFVRDSDKGRKDDAIAFRRTPVMRIEVVMRKTILGFHVKNTPFFKVFTQLPSEVPKLRRVLEAGCHLGRFGLHAYQPYEADYLFVLRFMTDCKITGGSWVTLPAGKYKRIEHGTVSTCQLEVEVNAEDVIPHDPDDEEWGRLAPMRILSFDIECAGRRGAFPDANIDPVIQIANYVQVQGESEPLFKNIFCLNSCSPIVGAQVLCFDDEETMLLAWREFVAQVDPDILTGYNIVNFDIPYLINRAEHLKVEQFPYLGRLSRQKTKVRSKVFSTKQTGKRDSKEINTDGRIQFDMYQVISKDYKLTQYTLNAVSAHFLGEQKEDVHHSIITELFKGTSETRHRLAVYCIKDAYLPIRLIHKLMSLFNYVEMARVTGVPLSYLLTRGQQIKVLAQLFKHAGKEGLLIPTIRSTPSDEKYEGAIVIDPLRGFYDEPISVMDFSSLYPSIMQAHNLCYSTLVNPMDVKQFAEADKDRMLDKTPTGAYFVKKDVYHGLLPRILENLLAARRRAKADLKKETDPFKKAVLDGRQLALKISANSVYGFTGATAGRLPCLAISSSVTAYGRQMIEETKRLVQEKYTKAAGYPIDAQVVYGDTDSVMVKFGVDNVADAMTMGKEAASFVTGHFIKPINLEFEKVYFPFLLINKKRYAGMYYTTAEKADKMDTKGIETVRRDNCGLVRRLVETVLQLILENRDVPAAKDFAKRTISDLLRNRVDMSLLVITKQISRSDSDYKGLQAHVELAKRMRKRDAGSAPVIGDRVPYVIIKGPKGARAHEKSEDPIYVLEHNIPIDTQYYLDQQIAKPLMRIFDPIMMHEKDPENLLCMSMLIISTPTSTPISTPAGAHTRTISVPTPSSGGLMAFAVAVRTCLLCKAKLKSHEGAVCAKCRPRESEALVRSVQQVSRNEQMFARLWTQCQRCQGSLTNDVLCTNRDCPIFYMRVKMKKTLADSEATLKRFKLEGLDW